MNALYNEIEPFAADWLDELARQGHIAPGRVERRSVADLTVADVAGPGQRHFFAGIGGWALALKRAGVADNASVWTGSCPCQPFSSAGKGRGVRDPRHLWPAWFRLIEECKPAVIFGEQVASRLGLAWFDGVRLDLERCGYAVGAADLCAASHDAIHVRQRLWWVAHAEGIGRNAHDLLVPREPRRPSFATRRLPRLDVAGRWWWTPEIGEREPTLVRNHDGLSGCLAGLGNAIVPQVAATFIEAALDAIEAQQGAS